MDFDTSVKMKIYAIVAESGSVPTAADVANTLGSPVAQCDKIFRLSRNRQDFQVLEI